MSRKTQLLSLLTIMVLILSGCYRASESERLLSVIKWYGEPAEMSNTSVSYLLDCSVIPEYSRGKLSFLGLRVGVTTYQEMLEVLDEDEVYWGKASGYLVLEESGPWQEHTWGYVHACFLNGRLSAIKTRGLNEYPETINGFVEEFGTPDLVTWSGQIDFRIALWIELGLVGAFSAPGGQILMVFLISPMDLDEFEGSWLYDRIQYEPDYYINDFGRFPPVEDPWGYTTDD